MPETPSLYAVPPAQHHRPAPEDASARRGAIDTTRSILVQAPAGAGKTNLLTQRFLALLAEVEEPEQILAITFTRAATAEMRGRILGALEKAREKPVVEANADEGEEVALARAALRHADALGWRLLEQPHRLDVQTIDSLCLRLAYGQPLLARLGGALAPTEDAAALYATAARRTAALLGRADQPDLQAALRTLLLRRDNNLPELERLLTTMLARRDAWLPALPLRFDDEVDWDAVRTRLEEPFARENHRVLSELYTAFSTSAGTAPKLLEAARYAAVNLRDAGKTDSLLHALHSTESLPGRTPEHREHWLALASLLLKQDGGWRKQWNVTNGFPAPGTGPGKDRRTRLKQQMESCCRDLQSEGGDPLQQLLCRLRTLPPLRYTGEQWQTLLAVFRVLRRAAAELRLVFAEANAVDFVEIAQAAQAVVEDETSMRGLLESERKRHLLIDEFQDTSRAQYRLIAELLREWSEGDRRTVFVVGDPLQSIYGFRQAEVALFHETREHGLPCGDGRRHPCHTLQLTHNFRSHAELVGLLNERFEKIFAGGGTQAAKDTFVAAHAWPQAIAEQSLQLHTFFTDKDAEADPEQARRAEAAEVARVLQGELPHIAAAEADGKEEYRVAVLVRSRGHLAAILPALRAANIPYRAVELEPLADQPEVHDLAQLLRALLHPAERAAWLTALRAPWCGLLLRDLHVLCGEDDPVLLGRPIPELIAARIGLLSPDGQARLGRTWGVLSESLRTRYSEGNNQSLAAWVERTWMALGGPACVHATARENVEAFFRLLDDFEPSGIDVLRGDFGQRLAKLCAAPDTGVSERFGIQLMTVHKAKGLGFEVVLLPGLERKPRGEATELVAMLERVDPERTTSEPAFPKFVLNDELLLAPVPNRDSPEPDKAYRWVTEQRKSREADERRRLFYVACTRARTRLHLFAAVAVKDGEVQRPNECSLLAAAWPAFEGEIKARVLMTTSIQTDLQAGTKTRAESQTGLALAAAADEPDTPVQTIDRLPSGWMAKHAAPDIAVESDDSVRKLFTRAEGSLAARARGTAMHALMEQLTVLFAAAPPHPLSMETWREQLRRTAERVLRDSAFPREKLRVTIGELADQSLAVATSNMGRWLLGPHPGALTESAWQSWDAEGNLRTLRIDRSFVAGEAPGQAGGSCLWIVDYKTGAHTGRLANAGERAQWLSEEKAKWRGQLEAYGAALTAASEHPLPVRYALYFPELLEMVYWSREEG